MTKKEIVKQISDELGLTQLKTKEIVQQTFDAIVETLLEDGRIELRNFGVFEVKRRKARKARTRHRGQGGRAAEERRHVQARQGDGGARPQADAPAQLATAARRRRRRGRDRRRAVAGRRATASVRPQATHRRPRRKAT